MSRRRMLLVLLAVAALAPALAAAAERPVPQDKVVDDNSPLPERHSQPDAVIDLDDVAPDESHGVGRRKIELVVGATVFVGLLIYALLRWQARAAHRH